ncbi:MAG: phosphate ABC transporter permease PstA [Planctomyces sp.]|nr:phosphate ABC transporter permease PstA [Planctomyces sp.]
MLSTLPQRHSEGWVFAAACRAAAWSSFGFLTLIIGAILFNAWGLVDWRFLTSYDSRFPEKAGVLAGLLGSFWVILLTGLFSVPIGVGAAIFLEEYSSDTWLTRIIRTNLANLAGVPSVVYGMLGLTVFVRMFGMFDRNGLVHRLTGHDVEAIELLGLEIPLPFNRSVIAGALTLTLLILPTIIVASQEALRAVPPSIRHAALALGATRWQMIRGQVLPASVPGIVTGVILAISRAIGETAPLIVVGATTFVLFSPGGIDSPAKVLEDPAALARVPFDRFTALPIQVYYWVEKPQVDFQRLASAAIVVLLGLLLALNGLALFIRFRYQKNLKW